MPPINFLARLIHKFKRGSVIEQPQQRQPLTPERIRQLLDEAERAEAAERAAIEEDGPMPLPERMYDQDAQWSWYAEPEATEPAVRLNGSVLTGVVGPIPRL